MQTEESVSKQRSGVATSDITASGEPRANGKKRLASLIHDGARLGVKVRELTAEAVSRALGTTEKKNPRSHAPLAQISRSLGLRRARRKHALRHVMQQRTITILRSAEELERLWSEPGTLKQVMGHLANLQEHGLRTRWSVPGPLGTPIEWETEVIEHRPAERISWRAAEGGPVRSEGSIAFKPAAANRGTEVTLQLSIDMAGSGLDAVAELVQEVEGFFAAKALRRFKSLAEAGEIPTVAETPAARPSVRHAA
jgi:uncharacterized membrane protein